MTLAQNAIRRDRSAIAHCYRHVSLARDSLSEQDGEEMGKRWGGVATAGPTWGRLGTTRNDWGDWGRLT
jgi:hypothetical protein